MYSNYFCSASLLCRLSWSKRLAESCFQNYPQHCEIKLKTGDLTHCSESIGCSQNTEGSHYKNKSTQIQIHMYTNTNTQIYVRTRGRQNSERLQCVSAIACGEDHITIAFDGAELKNVLPRAEDNLGFRP